METDKILRRIAYELDGRHLYGLGDATAVPGEGRVQLVLAEEWGPDDVEVQRFDIFVEPAVNKGEYL